MLPLQPNRPAPQPLRPREAAGVALPAPPTPASAPASAPAPRPGGGLSALLRELPRIFQRRQAEPYPPLLRPMPGVITQGVRPGHPALDIACNVGTPVRAAHDGQGGASTSHTHGITFTLKRSDGLVTSYSHLQSAKPGGPYKRGDLIGACGNTGSWTTGPHLHFESNRPALLGNLADR